MNEICTRRQSFKVGLASATDGLSYLLRGLGRSFEAFHEAFGTEESPAPLRPPGALEETEFLEKCNRCGDCVVVCPHQAIRKAGPDYGPSIEGTPVMVPQENPCLMCADFPCIDSCGPAALVRPGNAQTLRIGLAAVREDACYMALGQPCDYCMKECPLQPKAIVAHSSGSPARVDAAACTGCGLCAHICPADAVSIEACP